MLCCSRSCFVAFYICSVHCILRQSDRLQMLLFLCYSIIITVLCTIIMMLSGIQAVFTGRSSGSGFWSCLICIFRVLLFLVFTVLNTFSFFCYTFLPFRELSLEGMALPWLTNHHPSVLWHCWLSHLARKVVPEMTYNVSSGTLNCIYIHTSDIVNSMCWLPSMCWRCLMFFHIHRQLPIVYARQSLWHEWH